jgi:hypothetical protein
MPETTYGGAEHVTDSTMQYLKCVLVIYVPTNELAEGELYSKK